MIVRWFIVVLLIAQAQSACVKNKIKLWSPTKCEAGRSFFAKLSIIPDFTDKKIAQPYLYPWLAEIRITPPGLYQACTGVLINDRYVITSQNCIYPPVRPEQLSIEVGFFNGYKKDLSEIFQPRVLQRKARRIILHPHYDPKSPSTASNNLGLIKLDEAVKYSKTIYPIQLPAPGEKFTDYTNQLGENVEWSFFGPDQSKQLKENSVKVLSADECAHTSNDYQQVVNAEVLCSVNVGNGTRPCGEEHGGLLSVSRTHRLYNITVLLGITAWEPQTSCQESGPPRVYVRIDHKLSWIKSNTPDGLYCRY